MEKVIFHKEGLKVDGKGHVRTAVRAVIVRNRSILMIHSGVNGDYKFPGGGIEEGESHQQALVREVREECGLDGTEVGELLGHIAEYDAPVEEALDFFRMDSIYYRCGISNIRTSGQNLDQYEKELEFTPIWVDIKSAVKNNKKIIESKTDFPRWVIRDTMFLEYLLKQII